MPRLYLDYFRRGVARTFSYELIDEWPDPGRTDIESALGLLRNDFSEKPAYVVLKRLLALLSDPGARFDPGSLDYQLEGSGALRQLLLQKRDGRYYLVLWRATSVWDPVERHAVDGASETVRLALEGSPGVAVYRPNRADAPVERRAGRGPLDIRVGPEVTVLEIRAPGAGVRALRAPCSSSRAPRALGGRRLRLMRPHERRLARVLARPACVAAKPRRRERAERWLRRRARMIRHRAGRTGWQRHHRRVRYRTIRAVVRRG
jgi:hypothetical protein